MRKLPVEFLRTCFEILLTSGEAVDLVHALEANPHGGVLLAVIVGTIVVGVVACCAIKHRNRPPAP
ncbi:hypothetical protein RBA41_28665 [Massilia sp. CCM 9210]|uniref:hypothetical protein n=1 Tax=Massilia scottii TaxID=3057166 RepID=UPI00279659EC|nr:hypothetical protein [Massilia sp. CCM 9210]MDQ1817285.1 hypothetical protein [Massilia sp. CCM 9210]